VVKNWEFSGSVLNMFNRLAPFDPYTLVVGYSSYNHALHHSGAVRRFFTLGAKYTF
jgi:iron complex outermembrane receptor protein